MQDQTNLPQSGPAQAKSGSALVKKNKAGLKSVQADVVQLDQSSADTVNATNVNLNNSLVRQVNGEAVKVEDSVVGVVHGSSLSTTDSALGICSAVDANINGHIGVMIGQSVTMNNHRTGLVITREAHANHVQSILFLAGKNDAPVETILDQRSAALFGLTSGIALGLVLSLFKLLRR